MESEFYTLIQYLALERYSQQMEAACLGAIESQGSYPVFYLWKAVSLLFQERIPECIQELENTRDKKDVTLCALLALRYAIVLLRLNKIFPIYRFLVYCSARQIRWFGGLANPT